MPQDPYTYFRVEARELFEGIAQGVLTLEKDGPEKELVGRMLRMAHTLKGAARVVKQVEISEMAHCIEDILARHRDGDGPFEPEEIADLLRLVDRGDACVKSLSPAPASSGEPSAPGPDTGERVDSVRVEIGQLDSTLYHVAEAAAHLESLRRELPQLDQARRAARRLAQRSAVGVRLRTEMKGAAAAPSVAGTIADDLRSGIDRIHGSLRAGIDRLERDLSQILERVSRFRLLPANVLFPALERSVRDAAEELNKRVAFEMSGGQQCLDAHILLGLRDALIHAVRNAVVHGIEPGAARAAAGKPAAGRARLAVERSGPRIHFRVEDDGRGLDLAAVRKLAAARGLVTDAAAESMEPHDACQLLLAGGLSTAPAVSQLSGRGVGLDVVRAAALRLKGETRLSTEPGRGTAVEIDVPASLEFQSVLAVEIDDRCVLIPFDSVRRAVRVADSDLAQTASGTALLVGDEAIPFRPLTSVLGFCGGGAAGVPSAIVLHASGARAAIGVDRLLGVRDVVVRPLSKLCGAVPLVSGATINGIGTPELVLDPAQLVAATMGTAWKRTTPTPRARPTVLVVDDSLTTRMLEQSILESASFDVDLAVSGEEGLHKARGRAHELILIDVEMPGMSGFDVLRELRADPALCETPAIMITSRASPEDRLCAAQNGARDYIVKSEFDELRLLRIVRGLIEEVAT